MEKAIFKITALALISSVNLISCKKENNDVSAKTKLLTQQDWKLSKKEEKVNSDPFIDYLPSLMSCTQDDKYIFRTNNSYEINEGATKCNNSDPEIILTGTWQFTQNETKIKIDAAESLINQLDNSTLIISGSYYTNPDTNYYRYTFVH